LLHFALGIEVKILFGGFFCLKPRLKKIETDSPTLVVTPYRKQQLFADLIRI